MLNIIWFLVEVHQVIKNSFKVLQNLTETGTHFYDTFKTMHMKYFGFDFESLFCAICKYFAGQDATQADS